MGPKHFLNFQKISNQELVSIIDRGIELKNSRESEKTLKGKTLGLVFEQPSTRTRVSFEVGINDMGGSSLFLSGNELQLSRGEPISDTAKVLSSMLDVIVLRTDNHEKLEIFSQNSSVPLINGLSNLFHPCQIMADLMTFREISEGNSLEKVCWIGDGNNVCHSYIEAARLLNFELSIFCPKGYEPNANILESSKKFVSLTTNKEDALRDADIVTTDVWTSMSSSTKLKERKKIFREFFVCPDDMKKAKEKSIFLHCLPAHRGEEITVDMLEDQSSKVWIQAENRMHVQKAILEYLLID